MSTTGREEVDAPIALGYTRSETIVINGRVLASQPDEIVRHELFHVLTRHAPGLRDALYALIGYRRVPPIALPPALEARRLTNRDSPVAQHVIGVRVAGVDVQVADFLFADRPYDGGDSFAYLAPRLVAVDGRGQVPLDPSGSPSVFRIEDVEGYFEQVGRNTDYVIQPEEVLADNFASLLLGGGVPPPPELLEAMLAVLRDSP